MPICSESDGVCWTREPFDLDSVGSAANNLLLFLEVIMIPPVITANAILVWFVWGFFMALGWVLGRLVMDTLLGLVWRNRPASRWRTERE